MEEARVVFRVLVLGERLVLCGVRVFFWGVYTQDAIEVVTKVLEPSDVFQGGVEAIVDCSALTRLAALENRSNQFVQQAR